MSVARKEKKLEERVEAHLRTLKIPRELEDETRNMIRIMMSHPCFGNTE